MNPWFLVIFGTIMLAYAAACAAITLTGWQPNGYTASTQNDPSPGPNALF